MSFAVNDTGNNERETDEEGPHLHPGLTLKSR